MHQYYSKALMQLDNFRKYKKTEKKFSKKFF
jgi:hypothetical protein